MGNEHFDNLRSTTSLCRVLASSFTMTRVDKQRSVLGASVSMTVLPELKSTHDKLMAAQIQARYALYKYSVAYPGEEGWRVMPNEFLIPFATEFREANLRHISAHAELTSRVGTYLGEAKTDLSFKTTVPELLRSYTLKYKVHDYPAGSFAGYPDRQAQVLRGAYEAEMATVVANVGLSALVALSAPLNRYVERVSLLDQRMNLVASGEKANGPGVLRETVVDDVRSAIKLLGQLNITGDHRITTVLETLAPVLGTTPAQMKSDSTPRGNALRAALAAHRMVKEIMGVGAIL